MLYIIYCTLFIQCISRTFLLIFRPCHCRRTEHRPWASTGPSCPQKRSPDPDADREAPGGM